MIKTYSRIIVLTSMLSLLFLGADLPAIEYEGMLLAEINVVSNVNISDRRILALLDVKEGEPLSRGVLRSAFKDLFSYKMFRNLRFDLETNKAGRAVLNIIVDEYPKIGKISFVGNNQFSDEILRTEIPVMEGDYYSENLINRTRNFIREKYREEGYLMTRVRVRREADESEKSIDLIFDIEEGAEMLVKQIEFIGNKKLESKDIKRQMETKEDKWFREGSFDEFKFEEDKDVVVDYYKQFGYINARVKNTKISYRWRNPRKKKARDMYIRIYLEEGEQFFFGDLEIKGNKLFSEQELRAVLKRKKGEVFNQAIHDEDVQRISMMYSERGFIFARVTDLDTLDPETRELNYIFDIYEGDKAHIENIFVQGNERTKDHVILRELDIREGELFNSVKVQRSVEKLMQLQFFKNVVPDLKPGSVEGLMNLVFDVEEQRTGIVSAGAGFGTQSGVTANFEIRQNNFLGKGQSLSAKVEIGQRIKSLMFSFTEPWLFGLPILGGASLDFTLDQQRWLYTKDDQSFDFRNELTDNQEEYGTTPDLERVPFSAFDIGFSLTSGVRFKYWYSFLLRNSLRWTRNFLSRMTMESGTDLAPYRGYSQLNVYEKVVQKYGRDFFEGTGVSDWVVTDTITLNLTRDSRNHAQNPSRGFVFKSIFDFVFLDEKYTKMNFHYSHYFNRKWLWKVVFALSGDLFHLGNPILGRGYEISDNFKYRFYREELRGWSSDYVASFRAGLPGHDPTDTGEVKIRYSGEIRFPFTSFLEQYLWGVLFIDAGHLWGNRNARKTDNKRSSLQNLNIFNHNWSREYMYSVGWGVRIHIPMIPIRLYWCYRFYYDPTHPNHPWTLYGHEKTRHNKAGYSNGHRPEFVFNILGFF